MTVMTATRPGRVEHVTVTMPEALASTWSAIRKRHRSVPEATVQVPRAGARMPGSVLGQ